jgi:hypothetical protein
MEKIVFSNVLLEGFYNRILACIPYGVDNIWMKTDGEERYHAANILGYDLQQWETLLNYFIQFYWFSEKNGVLKTLENALF